MGSRHFDYLFLGGSAVSLKEAKGAEHEEGL